ncbi:hypothetical protein MBGDC06_00651 [Thermoplasmatales archaeon SCGC AB-539-C06]|nr:hypothetical protein MBGDC06_00651 [Thermoplasmatales archaeon SCGC AB-539-C06]
MEEGDENTNKFLTYATQVTKHFSQDIVHKKVWEFQTKPIFF